MPRRKKKSAIARKPSLVFTESPVHIQKNVPSPVLCARHPPTASSVPADDLHNLHWVSPQFRNVLHSGGHGKHRLTRQRRHSIAGHKIVTSYLNNKENVRHPVPSGLSRFKSLKFLGDQTTVPSIVEDVEISVDTDTGTEDEENCAGCSYEIKDDDSQFDECRRNSNSSSVHNGDSQRHSENMYLGKENSLAEHGVGCVREGAVTEINNVEKTTPEDEINLSLSDSTLTSFEGNGNISGSKRSRSCKNKPPIKRLFASQLLPKCGKSGKLCSNFSENSDNVKPEERLTEVSNQSEACHSCEEEIFNSADVRRSARIQKLKALLQSTDSPVSCSAQSRRKHVLAPNTPENEYGWSKRKRQLIQYIKKKL